jgi:hypothetical protein
MVILLYIRKVPNFYPKELLPPCAPGAGALRAVTVVAYILYACDPAMYFGPAARAVRATVARLRANIVAPAR